MSSKRKGISAERELIKLFWSNRWACIRVAGSGSSQYPSPDLLAGNKIRKLGIECKVTSSKSKFFDKDEITQLTNFCEYFGAEAWIAVKFNRRGWYFFSIEDLNQTPKGYSVTEKNLEIKGLSFEELIN
ncbi:Holliday junction resolvase [Candidatus Woesearchaeota archaeon]|nr:Holliday junction resolvase [Candidatus Woesearchaeota archaeon]